MKEAARQRGPFSAEGARRFPAAGRGTHSRPAFNQSASDSQHHRGHIGISKRPPR